MTLVEMQGKRTKVAEDMNKLHADNAAAWSPELREKWNALKLEHSELGESVERQIFLDNSEKRTLANSLDKKGDDNTREIKPDGEEISWKDAFNGYLRYGNKGITQEARAALKGSMAAGEKRTTNIVGTDASGGYLVNDEYRNEIIQTMKTFGGMWDTARIMTTSTGANLPMPTSDRTSRKAAIVGEASATTPVKYTFGQFTLGAYKFTDAVLLSSELVQDDSYDLWGHISEFMAESFGRGTNTYFTTGTGSSQPKGVTVAATDCGTTVVANTITRQKLNILLHTVDPAYRMKGPGGARFMFADSTLALIEDIDRGSSDALPVWQPSMRDGAPDTILGFPYTINQDMPTVGTSTNRGLLFGLFSKYIIREVRGVTVRSTVDRHIETDEIGFYATARYDGDLSDTAAIKYMAVA